MLEIAEQEITLYLDIMSIVTMIGFMMISTRFRQRKTPGDRIYFIMCISVLVFTTFNLVQIIVSEFDIQQNKKLIMVLESILELSKLFLTYQWLLFVGYWVYESADHLRRKYWVFILPLILLTLMYVMNLFTGSLFYYDDDLCLQSQPLYFLVILVQLTYFVSSGVLIWRNNRTTEDSMKIFHFIPIIIPFIFGFIQLVFSRIDTGPISFTTGVIFVFFSMTERWQYDSEYSGFFHAAILKYMIEQAESGKADYWSSILFRTRQDERALADIIRKELPRQVKPIHIGKGSFAVCLDKGKDDLKYMITTAITDAADEYDEAHKKNPIALLIEVRDRKKDESVEKYLSGLHIN